MKKNLNIIILGLAALSLSSCKTLYGKYERPEVKTSGIVRDVASDTDTLAVKDTTTFANIPWRSVFTDPQLQSIIEKGLNNNVNLLNAALNVKIAEEQLKCAKLAFVPSLAFTPQGTIASWDGQAATKTYTMPVTASWMVDLFGNLLSQKRSAQMALLQLQDYQVSVKTKDTWETMQKMHDLRLGYRTPAIQSAESNYYSVLTQKTDLLRQIRETENSLSLLIGDQAHSIARGKLDNQSLPSNFSTGVGIQLLNNRADVHAAEMNLAQCFYGVETARSKFYPSITISGTGAFTNSGGMGIVNPGKWLLSAVGSLTQPIFQNGRIIAGLKVAKMQYEQAYNTWQNTVLKAGSEVSNALVLYNYSDEKSKIEQKRIEVLEKNVESTKELMGIAGSSYLEIIQAQSSLLNVQLSKVADDFYKMQAVVNLYYALGGGAK